MIRNFDKHLTVHEALVQVVQGDPNRNLDVAGLSGELHCAGFEACHIQQIPNPVHPVRFFEGGFDQALADFGIHCWPAFRQAA